MTEELLNLLEAVRYVREGRDDRDYVCDVPCDEEDYGARAVHRNPDGPEAAALIRQLKADNERKAVALKKSEAFLEVLHSTTGGDARKSVWKVIIENRAAQSLNQTERGE